MKKIYIVPNFVTTINLFCGFYSILLTIKADYVMAGWFILIAGLFDALDGRIARLARATSSFGVEYDSLSDVVSFGLAPSLLFYFYAFEPFGRIGILIAFLFVLCGALRLARFNVVAEEISKAYFQGLPIPIAAFVVATSIIHNDSMLWLTQDQFRYFALVTLITLAILMVTTIPFPSFKELNWRSKTSFGYLLGGLTVLIVVGLRPDGSLFLLTAGYVILSLIWAAMLFAKGALPSQRVQRTKKAVRTSK